MFRPVLGAVGLCLALLLLPSSNAFAGAVMGVVDWIGVRRPANNTYYLRAANAGPGVWNSKPFGNNEDLPIAGQWAGAGTDDLIGSYRPSTGTFFFRDSNFDGPPTITSVTLGQAGSDDVPIAGNWNEVPANGDSVGMYRPPEARFYFCTTREPGSQCGTGFAFGSLGDLPVIGDWTGGGADSIGTFRMGRFFLRDVKETGGANPGTGIGFGGESDLPIAGDWDGDGDDTIGTFRPATATESPRFFFTNTNMAADAFPGPGQAWGQKNGSDLPVIGHWEGFP